MAASIGYSLSLYFEYSNDCYYFMICLLKKHWDYKQENDRGSFLRAMREMVPLDNPKKVLQSLFIVSPQRFIESLRSGIAIGTQISQT